MAELSAAERFAQAQVRNKTPLVNAFREKRPFDLDPFQIAAANVLEAGNSVLVAAPTGAGKTVVAEFAVYLAMNSTSDKVFYTTPMKALSNQKYNEFVAEWGAENVGILTGDTNVNSSARIVVMTTEVLRNMLYADSDLLTNLRFVVMDEVHYLADRFRGAVWEEVIIHLPEYVRLVGLSATVSNAEEFGDWLQAVRGNTDIIVSEDRPVPLDQHVLVGNKFIDLFDSAGAAATHRVNPELIKLAHSTQRAPHIRGGGRNSHRGGKQNRHNFSQNAPIQGRMDRADIIEMLGEKNLLPAISFIFSRAGCDQAVSQVLRSGVKLTTKEEREEIRDIVEERCRSIADEDLGVLGYWQWLEGLELGVAAHHAGLLPAFKEVVEELFQKKLVKVVFATETLALGINMPARTVVLEKLEKFNGEARLPLTPGEYTQLTGRAGRRGIDVEGHSLIQWSQTLDPQTVANLASRRTYPLNSSFRPTYNMAINLIEQFGRSRTRDILESSFAQFQADRAVVDLATKVKQHETTLEGYAEPMRCHLGDFAEYAALRRQLTDLEKQTEAGSRAAKEKRSTQLNSLRKDMKSHSCHHCPDREQHARWAERWWRLKRDIDKLVQQINTRTGAVARIFDRVCYVLVDMDYLMKDPQGTEFSLTPKGESLGKIYGERDLLIAESIRLKLWEALDAPGLAAMACAIVFEPRREEGIINERYLPRGTFIDALHQTQELWSDLEELENFHKLPGTNPVSTGLCLAMHKWAKGSRLDDVLFDADMPAGDFVRWAKQTIDLLDQLSQVTSGQLQKTARLALDQVRRGIVAYSTVG
ncbi:ATP-dependent RNA helicase HelY [Aurantimicrobium minutum]|uniref:DEAD/DEAH box helicase n=1 Tax=Aurantimicrobium minutum TaxID=708131 RepID=UPI0024760643|nr:DEAD/DEAH box helicase [Aurantimicrobium minutum]MDH6532923.1 ATP-dependent RNA helicase HelY [Aurantimicrobium minutum]